MRTPTKLATGLMGLGLLAVSYKVGLPPVAAVTNTASHPEGPTQQAVDPTPTPTATAAPQPSSPATNNSGSSGTKPRPVTKPSETTAPAPAPEPAPVPAPVPVTPTTSTSATGDAVGYRFGTVQVSVTKDSAGTITAVKLVRASATGGRQVAFNSLVAMAVAAQGSTFGNISQATYTTDAFKTALDSALAKF